MKKILSMLGFVFFFFFAIGAWGAEPRTHVIKYGETLYSISRKYDVPYEAIISANKISNPSKIVVGMTLIIPSVHTVLKGETLYGISHRYGISVSELLAANKLNANYVLKIGDTLIVPASETAPPPKETTTTVKETATAKATTTSQPAAVPKPVPTTLKPENAAVAPSSSTTVSATQSPPPSTVPMPEPLKTQGRVVDMKLSWPADGKAAYLDGKLEGVMIRANPGETEKAVADGVVVSAGPSRGFGQVVFVQAKSGFVYVYGGNESLSVKAGDQISSGKELGKVGIDAKDGSPIAYFFVFRNGQPVDPATAPRN